MSSADNKIIREAMEREPKVVRSDCLRCLTEIGNDDGDASGSSGLNFQV